MKRLQFRTESDSSGKTRYIVDGMPMNCVSLVGRPDRIEDQLLEGRWIVLSFPTWSPHGIFVLAEFLEIARAHVAGDLHFGIRSYDDEPEFDSWCPEVNRMRRNSGGYPFWIFFRGGEVVNILRPPLSRDDLNHKVVQFSM